MACKFQQDGKTETFPNNGRGVFIYTKRIEAGGSIEIYLTPDKVENKNEDEEKGKDKEGKPKANYMLFKIDCDDVHVSFNEDLKPNTVSNAKGSGRLEVGKMASYWISVDRDSFQIKYGKGYLMKETTCYAHDFSNIKSDDFMERLFSPALPLYLMVFIQTEPLQLSNPMIDAEPAFQFKTRPLAGNLPPLVKDSSTVTLLDLDSGEFTFSPDLPTASQELYQILKGCDLECEENSPIKLSDAIRYSINEEGMFLNNIIKSKKGQYYTDGHIYIRVTLGPDMRTGPGNPFVLELWPSGNESPIHNHGAACAIIKILFGQIHISIYNKATDPLPSAIKPLTTFVAKQGDFTWMDENWYQTHKLENKTNDFCATIQSYRYRSDDKMQWPGFDYIKDDPASDSQGIFYPSSDTTFKKMKDAVLKEYADHLSGRK